jgi:phage host-nuclease inhibitor protein Gam
MQPIIDQLHQLSEMKAAADALRLEYEARRAEIMKPVQDELAALELEFAPLQDTLTQNIAELELAVKQAVLQHGTSVRGDRLQAVFTRGRVTWDTKNLDLYARTHPEVLRFRKVGTPSVSVRAVQTGGARANTGEADELES